MPTFRVTGGALSGVMMSGDAGIDNTLPEGPGGPVDPGWGNRPPMGGTLPEPPPGIWPPPTPGNPVVPIGPDNTLPVQPGTIWPSPGRPPHVGGGPMPGRPPRPDAGLPGSQPGVDNTLPGQPGAPDNTLPGGPAYPDNTLPSQTFWMLAYCPSLGWKYIVVDPSLQPGTPLPPTAEPRRRQAPP